MALIVQKYGGTSIATVERIRNVAYKVAEEVNNGNQVAVVVSAMAGVTNSLISLINDCVDEITSPAEYDVVAATGEQVTAGLLALTLQNIGIDARSWMGWQIPINTDSVYKKAMIENIDVAPIIDSMNKGSVAVIAGFQGKSADNRITTLGRGGSDATAVALAHYLKAERCDIFTDVDGVFTADPRIISDARKIDHLNFDEMLEFSTQGAKVLQAQSVLLAKQYDMPVHILSSLTVSTGTLVSKSSGNYTHKGIIGIASDKNCALVGFELGQLNKNHLEEYLNEHHISVSAFDDGKLDYMIVRHEDLETVREYISSKDLTPSVMLDKVAKVSLVGNSMNEFEEIIKKKVATVIAQFNINWHADFTTSKCLSIVVSNQKSEELVRELHKIFNLAQLSNVKLASSAK